MSTKLTDKGKQQITDEVREQMRQDRMRMEQFGLLCARKRDILNKAVILPMHEIELVTLNENIDFYKLRLTKN